MTKGYRFCHSVRVRYAEIDGQMIVFNSHYLTYCDIGITEYLRNLGITTPIDPTSKPEFDFALVKTTLEFKGPGVFDDILHIYVKIPRLGNSSFTTKFMITREDDPAPLVIAESIYAGFDSSTRKSIPIPDNFRNLIETFEQSAPVLTPDI
ncbi:MAG: acyl-CoA thioesterase [Syntrophomonadaceae bacterium]|nr:acyl-CoA thioesterase [Syntrophomonadaceae bacterium]